MTPILLAAGFAKRFGSQKLLAKLPDGRCVVEAAAQNLLACGEPVIAVTGDDANLQRVLEGCGCRVVVNADAQAGMGASIAAGVRASPEADGWLVALGDMPYVQPATIARIRQALPDETGIVAPTFDRMRGHPVAFGRAFRDELLSLTGDLGARSVVASHADRLVLLPVDDAGVLADIDTPGDLDKDFPHHRQ